MLLLFVVGLLTLDDPWSSPENTYATHAIRRAGSGTFKDYSF